MIALSAFSAKLVPLRYANSWAFVGLLLCSGSAAAAPIPLAAHRALYTLSLGSTRGSSAPEMAEGLIAYEFSGSACRGYVSDFRQMTELQPQEGAARVTDMRSTTFEGGNARSFNFKVESVVDGQQAKEVEGDAKKTPNGVLSIDLSRPRKTSLSFHRKVMFPTEQIIRILDAARAGKSLLPAKVFDGSDTGDKVYNTLAVIGHASYDTTNGTSTQFAALKGVRYWPVTISYFDDGRQDSGPKYTLSFNLYENGISRALKLDYGDFTLAGKLTKLELLPNSAACAK